MALTDEELATKLLSLKVRLALEHGDQKTRDLLGEAALRIQDPPQTCMIDLSRAPILQRLLAQ